MAKFLAELLGCTLPDKGNPPLFEVRMMRGFDGCSNGNAAASSLWGWRKCSLSSLWQQEAEALFIDVIDSCYEKLLIISDPYGVEHTALLCAHSSRDNIYAAYWSLQINAQYRIFVLSENQLNDLGVFLLQVV